MSEDIGDIVGLKVRIIAMSQVEDVMYYLVEYWGIQVWVKIEDLIK